MVLLDVENIGQQRQNGEPVIQAHAIDHHKKHLLPGLHARRDKFRNDIHREHGRIFFVADPMFVIVLDEFAKSQVARAAQIVVHGAQARIVKAIQFQIPFGQADVEIDPIPP